MRFLLKLVALGVLVAGSAFAAFHWHINQPRLTESYILRIPPGDSAVRALSRIPQLQLNPLDRLALRLWSRRHTLRHGLYTLDSQFTLQQILQRLTEPSEFVQVTIVEGDNMFEVARKLQDNQLVMAEDFLAACRDPELIQKIIGVQADRCEGFLWPETYALAPYDSARDILKVFVNMFWNRTAQTLATAGFSREQPQSVYRIVTLASIVEKETGAAHERPLIASVFLNRLIRGMRLQSDPTTIYGIWERFDGNLRKSDLQQATRYNTYRINGLPPTPIANPGLAAIEAVLNPTPSNYLYFVAKGSAGVHQFTETYDQHRAAIREHQLQ